MSDEISDLVDWQIANRPAFEVITHVCRVCLTQWTCDATACPACEAPEIGPESASPVLASPNPPAPETSAHSPHSGPEPTPQHDDEAGR